MDELDRWLFPANICVEEENMEDKNDSIDMWGIVGDFNFNFVSDDHQPQNNEVCKWDAPWLEVVPNKINTNKWKKDDTHPLRIMSRAIELGYDISGVQLNHNLLHISRKKLHCYVNNDRNSRNIQDISYPAMLEWFQESKLANSFSKNRKEVRLIYWRKAPEMELREGFDDVVTFRDWGYYHVDTFIYPRNKAHVSHHMDGASPSLRKEHG